VNGLKALSLLPTISGSASDDSSGVALVQLSIKNTNNTTFWNGSTWTDTESWLNTAGTLLWFYASPAWTSGNWYLIQSKAIDNSTNEEVPGSGNSFLFDNISPSSTISNPTNNTDISSLTTISGTASDTGSSGLSIVRVSIKNTNNTLWYDGGGFNSGSEVWLDASGKATWEYTAPTLTTDRTYIVRSQAQDEAGNIETPSIGITFGYSAYPSSIITFPANGAFLNGITAISGTASDSGSGVANVVVSIKNISDTSYWYGKYGEVRRLG